MRTTNLKQQILVALVALACAVATYMKCRNRIINKSRLATKEQQQSGLGEERHAIHHGSTARRPHTKADTLAVSSSSSYSSPACQPTFLQDGQPIERIFFLHMRKAGGTTIRRYLSMVAKHYNLTLDAREGMNTVDDTVDNHTLYVTNLREPNARTISNYKYDQRWDCTDLLKTNHETNDRNSTTTNDSSFVPTPHNTKSTLEDFIENRNHEVTASSLWTCSNNCYIRWVTGNYTPLHESCSPNLRTTEMARVEEAKSMLLQHYHLVFIAEWMHKESYIRQIEGMFGVPGFLPPTKDKKVYPYCAMESKEANAKIPLIISNQTQALMEDCNAPDLLFYQQMTRCPNGVHFPKFHPSKFKVVVNESNATSA